MSNTLKEQFPMLLNRNELLKEIRGNASLKQTFERLKPERQKEFLDFCTGVKGMRVLYDSFFKEVMNPEYAPERLEDLLSVLLKKRVSILSILPNDSTRIVNETSLLITDIVVELEDGSIANVEIQKIGYDFPSARSACYSADMLLRQYKRVRNTQEDNFSYHDIKSVYLIVIYEHSPIIFHEKNELYYHYGKTVFDSGLNLDLLQEYVMIPLDIFKKTRQNKPIETKLEAWLTFFGEDSPEKIMELISKFPEFKAMYETLFGMCHDVERVMNMFSKELEILDKNTVTYMIEEQQREIEQKEAEIKQKNMEIEQKDAQIEQKDAQIAKLKAKLATYEN